MMGKESPVSWVGCDEMLASAWAGMGVDAGAGEWSTPGETAGSGCCGGAAVWTPSFSYSSRSTSLSPLLWPSAPCSGCGVAPSASRDR